MFVGAGKVRPMTVDECRAKIAEDTESNFLIVGTIGEERHCFGARTPGPFLAMLLSYLVVYAGMFCIAAIVVAVSVSTVHQPASSHA